MINITFLFCSAIMFDIVSPYSSIFYFLTPNTFLILTNFLKILDLKSIQKIHF